MEHLRICSTSLKMLNRIYPLVGIVNCALALSASQQMYHCEIFTT